MPVLHIKRQTVQRTTTEFVYMDDLSPTDRALLELRHSGGDPLHKLIRKVERLARMLDITEQEAEALIFDRA